MSDTPVFDLDYRPEYWDPANAGTAILANVKGQRRREMIEDTITGRAAERTAASGSGKDIVPLLAEVDPALLVDELEDPNALSWVDPTFMGGEFLPSYLSGEVEIARVVLDPRLTRIVFAIRARKMARCIQYRVLDEYETEWSWRPRTSRKPLTFGEIIGLIDSLDTGDRSPDAPDFLTGIWEWEMEAPTVEELEFRTAFATVQSVFYPQLEEYYLGRAKEWIEAQKIRFNLPLEERKGRHS